MAWLPQLSPCSCICPRLLDTCLTYVPMFQEISRRTERVVNHFCGKVASWWSYNILRPSLLWTLVREQLRETYVRVTISYAVRANDDLSMRSCTRWVVPGENNFAAGFQGYSTDLHFLLNHILFFIYFSIFFIYTITSDLGVPLAQATCGRILKVGIQLKLSAYHGGMVVDTVD